MSKTDQLREMREAQAKSMEIGKGPVMAEDHVREAWGAWQDTVDGIMRAARHTQAAFDAAKEEGIEWQTFFAAKGERVEGEHFPFGDSTARMLRTIATDSRLVECYHGNALPPAWRTLYKLSTLDDEEWEKVEPHISPDMERRDITRLLRDGDRGEAPPLPKGIYRVVYADPPWSYGQSVEGYGPAEFHYPTMDTEDICEMGVREIVADDAALFLWTTSPKLREGLAVVDAWGFSYKASFVWDKVRHNYGHYNSVRHEFLLVATRGSCTPDRPKLYDSVVSEERTEHSRKPRLFREMIDDLYSPPDLPSVDRVELFARGELPEHWHGHGDEVAA
ncbi:MAG: hypothetical protein GWN53_17400 [Gammaproteobacteria bacterium]|uniref:N6-adenosine-specific RNA methylase IME4 n=1 Tax=Candidatus Kutchimonas denitrificans TaxID=3056748 RepID=A0AAE4ZAH8_9BACT|nr:hypothetical protein [Candidatus Kutchimonas denitrificans]NIV53618.1 hypothetical protein [Gammaproteobacteria bacterium]